VNKWMVRFWGVLALVALGALIGTTVWSAVPMGRQITNRPAGMPEPLPTTAKSPTALKSVQRKNMRVIRTRRVLDPGNPTPP
jgi:hypothetical protein